MANETNYIGVAMGLDVTDLKAGLSEANKEIQLANSEFKSATSGMEDWTKSTEGLNAKVKQLTSVLDMQQRKLAGLQAEYDNLDESSADYAEQARKLQVQINNQQAVVNRTSRELNNYKTTLEGAEKGTIDLENVTLKAGKAVEKSGEQAAEAESGWTTLKGAISTFVGNVLTNAVSKFVELGKSIYGLADATREYREDMGKLETAYESAGKSTELATKTYKEFYSVLGEEDRSVEAVNHLAQFVDTEQDMVKWTNIATGVWGTFGDSLPIEGLTEAANETGKTGKVTGVLADALNWANTENVDFGIGLKKNIAFTKLSQKQIDELTLAERAEYLAKQKQYEEIEKYNKSVTEAVTAEEKFQLALDNCSTEQERQALITNVLNGLYSEASNNYKENNASIIESRKATSDFTDAQAKLGERIEPITTKVREGFTQLLLKILELTEGVNFEELGAKITGAFDTFINEIMPKIVDGLQWIVDHKDGLITGILAIGSAFAAFKVVTLIQSVTSALKGMSLAQSALNLVMSMNPIGLIVAAIAALVAAFIYCWKNVDGFKEFWVNIWNGIVQSMKDAWNNIKIFINAIVQGFNDMVAWFKSLPSKIGQAISKAVDGVKEWGTNLVNAGKEAATNLLQKVMDTFVGIKDKFLDTGKQIVEGIWDGIKNAGTWIKDKITGFAGNVADWFKDAFKISSPSKLIEDEVGVDVGKAVVPSRPSALRQVKKSIHNFGNFVSDNLGGIKNGIASTNGGYALATSGATNGAFMGNGGTTINAGMTINYNGKLSRKELKKIENDNYTAIKMKLKNEGLVG